MKAFVKKNAAYLAAGVAVLVIAAVYYQTNIQSNTQSTVPTPAAEVRTEKSSSEIEVQPVSAAAPSVESVNEEAKPSVNSAPSAPAETPKAEEQKNENKHPESLDDEENVPGC